MARSRPLSPHLQVYRPQLTSMMSIGHRACGVALASGTALVAAWLFAVASGGVVYDVAMCAIDHVIGRIVLFGYSVALIYHALNGIRHLAWDLGIGFGLREVYLSGGLVLVLTTLLTAFLWLVA